MELAPHPFRTPGYKPIPPADCVHQLGSELTRLGFHLISRSKTGSRYFGYSISPFELRVSTYVWSTYSAKRQVQVVSSFVIPTEGITFDRLPSVAEHVFERYRLRVTQRLVEAGRDPAQRVTA